jgi:dUTP pyrophosphatase
MNRVHVLVKKLVPHAVVPDFKSAGASGADLYASESGTIPAHGIGIVSTGITVELPPLYELQVRSRSGLAAKNGIFVLNAPGTIDSDYRGELRIILANFGMQDFDFACGDRLAQLVLASVLQPVYLEVQTLSDTVRGKAGFGSTGV